MKNTLLSTLLVLTLLVAACKKENQVTPGVSAIKNGTTWIANSADNNYLPLNTKDTIYIYAHSGEEHLVMVLKQTSKGVFQLTDKTTFYVTVGYDVVTANYKLDNTASNEVAITTYDENKNQLKGTFNLTFKNNYNYGGYPDKVVFNNGKINIPFKGEYQNTYVPK